MLRAIRLTMQNEARLLIKDPIVLFMLLFAPVVIITVAGYSLGSLYGAGVNSFRVPVIDLDHGPVADGILKALRSEPSIAVDLLDDVEEARRLVQFRDRTPLAIEIPPGTSDEEERGGQPRLTLFVDPVRRVEVNALEVRVAELCRRVVEQAQREAQQHLDVAQRNLVDNISQLAAAIDREQLEARSRLHEHQARIEDSLRTQITATLKRARDEAEALGRARESRVWDTLRDQLAERQLVLAELQTYLVQLQASQRAFEDWFASLRVLAGRHAGDIPAPPVFPSPPAAARLMQLTQPLRPPQGENNPAGVFRTPAEFTFRLPKMDPMDLPRGENLRTLLGGFDAPATNALPGSLGFSEQAAIDGESVVVNAFNQYVPGFGVTFLMIGMMLGVALTLFDERDWGTLKRLRVGGAPLSGLLLGKVFARFLVGTVQMVLLFAVGWFLFGISFGPAPLALLIPTLGISFASASLGLVIASVAQAHDSVMPLGTVTSMAMAAIGGCWWPMDFEPTWMRALSKGLPTTWTMEAFNNLMLRNLPAASVWWPFAVTIGLGAIFLLTGILRLVRLED